MNTNEHDLSIVMAGCVDPLKYGMVSDILMSKLHHYESILQYKIIDYEPVKMIKNIIAAMNNDNITKINLFWRIIHNDSTYTFEIYFISDRLSSHKINQEFIVHTVKGNLDCMRLIGKSCNVIL